MVGVEPYDAVTAEENLAIAAAYAAASRRGDVDAIAALSEPDAKVWHNFDDKEVDLGQSARTVKWLFRIMPDVAWEDVAVLPTPTGYVWQAIITGTAPGGPIRAHTCMVVTVSEAGKVAHTAEYIDPAAMAALSA
jgi:ketosteroid isomerase-like protein